jgi:mannose-6-phosphate isomerase
MTSKAGGETPESGGATAMIGRMEKGERPWGTYVVLHESVDHKVKTITVDPGQRLSYQTHERRAEHWHIVAGSGLVTLDGVEVAVGTGSSVDVAVGARHRIANTGDVPLVFIEVQRGTYFGEDDIVRLDDDFGRSDQLV